MYGKIVLTSVDDPTVGCKVIPVVNGKHGQFFGEIISINPNRVKWGDGSVSKEGKKNFPTDLKQIGIEYEVQHDNSTEFWTAFYKQRDKKSGVNEPHLFRRYNTLTLHPDDWQYALNHIGEEAEFIIGTLEWKGKEAYAKLVPANAAPQFAFKEVDVEKERNSAYKYFDPLSIPLYTEEEILKMLKPLIFYDNNGKTRLIQYTDILQAFKKQKDR